MDPNILPFPKRAPKLSGLASRIIEYFLLLVGFIRTVCTKIFQWALKANQAMEAPHHGRSLGTASTL